MAETCLVAAANHMQFSVALVETVAVEAVNGDHLFRLRVCEALVVDGVFVLNTHHVEPSQIGVDAGPTHDFDANPVLVFTLESAVIAVIRELRLAAVTVIRLPTAVEREERTGQ